MGSSPPKFSRQRGSQALLRSPPFPPTWNTVVTMPVFHLNAACSGRVVVGITTRGSMLFSAASRSFRA
jgi:hypothetical protein